MKRILKLFVIICLLGLTSFNVSLTEKAKTITVVIDAGHGGHDPGCLGSKTKEKDIALAIALKLGENIEKNCPDVKVIYTRKTDVFVDLYKRAQIANENKADLFICIHCNSNPNKSSCGTETYVMGLYKTEANLNVAQKENSSILLEDDYAGNYNGFNPNSTEAYIIFSLYQNTYIDQSLMFATKVQKEVKAKAGMFDRGVKQAGFLVLWETAMPSVLIETGFLTNSKDEDFLSSENGQDQIASGIFNAFKEYKNELKGGNKSKNGNGTNNNDSTKYPKIKKDTTSVSKDTSKNVNAKKDIVFKVQFATSSVKKPLNSPEFRKLKDVQEYFSNGLYKYTTGKEATFDAAMTLLDKVHNIGFEDAFIIAFLNGERIPPQEAVKMIKKN